MNDETSVKISQPPFTPLTALIPKESALVNDFLIAENRILRSHLGKRIKFIDAEREELVRHGIPVKTWLAEICSIVRPETILKWHRQMKKNKWTYDTTSKKPGRPGIPLETESHIVTMARENRHWGYKRIYGELKSVAMPRKPRYGIFSRSMACRLRNTAKASRGKHSSKRTPPLHGQRTSLPKKYGAPRG